MSNKKIMVLSVVSVIVLVIAIVATSYAMFTANLSGTKANELTTGYVTLNCEETTFKLEDTSPMTDADGIKMENNEAICKLTSTMKGTMTIGYDIALDVIDESQEDGVNEDNVKIQVTKSTKGAEEQPKYLLETDANKGVYISSIQDETGQYNDDEDQGYNLDSDTITGDTEITYKIKTWVSNLKTTGADEEEVPNINESSSSSTCSNPQLKTKEECQSAGEIWGDEQTSTQKGGTFSFKLKITATQVLSDSGE